MHKALKFINEHVRTAINEHKTEVLVSFDLITDDDTGIYSGDTYDFQIHQLAFEHLNSPERKKEFADYLRKFADRVENNPDFIRQGQ
jgi:hypothetical protein